MITNFTHFVSVRFPNGEKSYYFGTNDPSLEIGTYVIVDTVSGFEMGIVTAKPISMKLYTSKLDLKAVIRQANSEDLEDYEMAKKQAKVSLQIADREAKKLNLGMTFVDAGYTLDGSKITITYTADGRVDFRELLRVLAAQLKCRIELHQIAPRDKAKAVGGLGICGLPLCCSTFLKSFDGISISRAKNQMLTLNIPKLSGQCGRLKCCLLYEDDMYTEAKKSFPRIGDKIHLPTGEYTVSSYNIMSSSIKLQSEDDVQFLTLEEYNKILHPTPIKPQGKNNQNNKQSSQKKDNQQPQGKNNQQQKREIQPNNKPQNRNNNQQRRNNNNRPQNKNKGNSNNA